MREQQRGRARLRAVPMSLTKTGGFSRCGATSDVPQRLKAYPFVAKVRAAESRTLPRCSLRGRIAERARHLNRAS